MYDGASRLAQIPCGWFAPGEHGLSRSPFRAQKQILGDGRGSVVIRMLWPTTGRALEDFAVAHRRVDETVPEAGDRGVVTRNGDRADTVTPCLHANKGI